MKERPYIEIRRKGRLFLLILGAADSIFFGFLAFIFAVTLEFDFYFWVLLACYLPGLFLVLYANNATMRLQPESGILYIRNIWGRHTMFSAQEVFYLRRTRRKLYFYNADKQRIGAAVIFGMKGVEQFQQMFKEIRPNCQTIINAEKENRFTEQAAQRRDAEAIIVIVVLAFAVIMLLNDYTVPIKLCFIGIGVGCLFWLGWNIYKKKHNYWFRTEYGIIHRSGKTRTFYPDQDIISVIDIGNMGNTKLAFYKVTWRSRRFAIFLMSPALIRWLMDNGYTEGMVYQASMDAAVKEEREEIAFHKAQGNGDNDRMIKNVRNLTRVIGIVSFAAFLALPYITDSFRIRYLGATVLPLANLILPCIFPSFYIVEMPKYKTKEYRDRHIMLPFMSLSIELLLLLYILPCITIQTEKTAILFAVILFLVISGIILVCMLPRKGKKGIAVFFCLLMLLYCYPATECLVMGLCSQEAVHQEAIVQEKKISNGQKNTYYLILEEKSGDLVKMKVTKSLYQDSSEGDTVEICQRDSIFGIQFTMVHD